MDKARLRELLAEIKEGKLEVDKALEELVHYPLRDLGHSCLDFQREVRNGLREVVYAEGKGVNELVEIVAAFLEDSGSVLVTRLRAEHIEPLSTKFPSLVIDKDCGVAYARTQGPAQYIGNLGLITAGTSDARVAEEARVCAEFFGLSVTKIYDVGVAGLHRLVHALPVIGEQDLLVVVAGMEGALPGIVAGLTPVPVIAVPTSVGYGASFGGITAFLSMLVSCSPGLTVVNIDNGFGAAVSAVRLIRHLRKKSPEG